MSQVLRRLPTSDDPDLLIGPANHSDCGAYRVADGVAILQSVDFFPPTGDDPFVYGQIAAANSLSDIYAMGGRPITALNIVGFPDDELPLETLNEILRGGAERVHLAGASILGGHTVRDKEIKYGLSVTGLADPDKIVTNERARPGDTLILTKPIGTGAMTAAFQKDKIDKEIWENCCQTMLRLNKAASGAMLQAGANSATDITGFGLLGHAGEMAQASGATLEIQAREVPLLEGAMELSKAGFVTRAAATNKLWLDDRLQVAGDIDPALFNLLIDAQTSGGLLISIEEAKIEAFAGAMNSAEAGAQWKKIGKVTQKCDTLLRLI